MSTVTVDKPGVQIRLEALRLAIALDRLGKNPTRLVDDAKVFERYLTGGAS